MPRDITVTLYKFDELSEEAQEKAISESGDYNVCYDWWDDVYMEVEGLGFKITGFDIDRGNYCNIEFKDIWYEVAQAIVSSHGEECETYKTAAEFLAKHKQLEAQEQADWMNGSAEDDYENDVMGSDLEQEFKQSLSEDYRILLKKAYEDLTSEQGIKDSLISQEAEFTKDGVMYHFNE